MSKAFFDTMKELVESEAQVRDLLDRLQSTERIYEREFEETARLKEQLGRIKGACADAGV